MNDDLHELRRRAAQEALDQIKHLPVRVKREPFSFKRYREQNRHAIKVARTLRIPIAEARRITLEGNDEAR